MGIPFYLVLEKQRRELEGGGVLPVRSLAYHEEHPYPELQVVRGVQICCRLRGDSERCGMEINGKRFSVRYPHLLIKRPNEVHRMIDGKWASAFYVAYPAEALEEIRRIGFEDSFTVCELPDSRELSGLFLRFQEFAGCSEDFGIADRIDLLAFQMMRELLLIRKRSRTPLAAADRKIREIASFLRMNFLKENDLDQIARHFGFSRRNFSRRWEKSGYPPPARFLFMLRMEEAKRLLAETSTPIWKIAELLHYQRSAWFCFAFRRLTGETPLHYRKRFRK